MNWKRAVNAGLARTGHQLQRVGGGAGSREGPPIEARPGDRLLEAPTFILCSVRSGSTLLRVLLNSHSQIHCPHELHLRDIRVSLRGRGYSTRALGHVGLDATQLRYLLWDRVLHRELAGTGKRLLVNKTPNDVFIADRILECWPDARFIFLLRHPGAIARSRRRARRTGSDERNVEWVRRYVQATEDARREHGDRGISVRYEDLASDPERETRRLCEFLGVPWEEAMLRYGDFDHGPFRAGLGDWSDNIKSGRVQPPAPLPSAEETPEPLRELAAAWGYIEAPVTAGSAEAG